MNYTEEEKQLLNEGPDFESQIQVLEDEHHENLKKRRFVRLACGILIGITTLFYVAFANVYVYRPYGSISDDLCDMVNLKIDGSPVPNLNVTDGEKCIPKYNIDYYLNGRPTFNIDIYGDRSVIFNEMNQKDITGTYCILNCDSNNDGWPDYNIDLNGDGTADVNIITDPKNKKSGCDLNCDINKDTIPDTNIDVDKDGKPDVNITKEDDYTKPIYNIDYKNDHNPTFNLIDDDGNITNPVNDASNGKECKLNCDINNDGWPDYNIDLDGDGKDLLNELIDNGDNTSEYGEDKSKDWKCYISKNLKGCSDSVQTNDNIYINIDVDNDGKPDVNISNDGGKTIDNPVDKDTNNDGIPDLNKDINNDGFPDLDIDIDGDGKPDINITDGKENKCIKNCDTNMDGINDYLSEVDKDTDQRISITNLNIDKDYDGVCDVNCDIDGDLFPDINIDTDGDLVPDINIDYNHDNEPDFNVDTNEDGKPDKNLDAYGTGECNFNCNNDNGTKVNKGNNCTKNCDTDNDGWPDKYVDVDNDGTCDFNCGNNGNDNKDKNHDYYLDDKENPDAILDIKHTETNKVYVTNPVDIHEVDIEPGWDNTYVLNIKNSSYYGVKYRIFWTKVKNEFDNSNDLQYFITRDGATYIYDSSSPHSDIILKDELIVKSRATMKYVLKISFKETGKNQNKNAGKIFYGQLRIEVIK